MVDLRNQYLKIKQEIDAALIRCAESAQYIKGPEVKRFEENMASYLGETMSFPAEMVRMPCKLP